MKLHYAGAFYVFIVEYECSGVSAMHALIRKLQNLGTVHDEELQALVTMLSVKKGIRRGEDIKTVGSPPNYSPVLPQALACRYKIFENGRRQIFTFQYPGDFCDGHSYILPTQDNAVLADVAIDAKYARCTQNDRGLW